MRAGLTLPQGCDREYLGIDAATAWRRTVEVAQRAEEAGFDSLWAYDHFQVDPPPEEAIVFDPFVELAALAMATSRATARAPRAGRGVPQRGAHGQDDLDDRRHQRRARRSSASAPAGRRTSGSLTATASRRRRRGWRSWRDHLEIITRMLGPGRATYSG